jgi:hypothetical protein
MRAQLITIRLKPGNHTAELDNQLRAAEQPGSGLVRTLVMHDQKDPSQLYALVVFESEDKTRAREQYPRRQERLHAARAMTAGILDRPPEFTGLRVAEEWRSGRAERVTPRWPQRPYPQDLGQHEHPDVGARGRQCAGRRVTRCGACRPGRGAVRGGRGRAEKQQRPRRGEGVGTARSTGGPRPGRPGAPSPCTICREKG